MAEVYAIDGVIPVVHPTAFVHPAAVLIGDVVIGPGCYIGPLASLRGDFGRIVVAAGSNVQDTCVLHSFPGKLLEVGENGHVGHGSVLHGCMVGRDALIGMNAVVMDGAEIGEAAFVAATAFVKAGFAVPPRTLVAGVPAKVVREVTEAELAWKREGTAEYQRLAERSRRTMRRVAPLTEMETDRPSLDVRAVAEPLWERKRR